ncbi:4-hydroxy-3-methylbut-2-enyl diphosphate reductase [Alkalihalobacillus trypoxylicola]|uniref:4-hydroxy-3-methylbut-2-enyl diphosphate reductase n=1 Tax=Alkalihalobacillus trypoxylicola TaxID=519424 RepID=A0A161QNS7_9BACI|nr:4-hydroxy-3-methylbut-2-enyl diphosphate reductase [Alkalihalobacillus trypoxylicola]KYG32053.1 4-hydroxy-3-methylbut-2-enyl diphosphate reductase [Alkalihalobacillus trypoxylicola]GAF65937.1 4-hydroxy-3-methylbut-2-enyl diphosphate reductase [Bacillus sp. TS-2]
MKVVKISPRGYCYGVVDAMVLARQAAQNLDLPRPIYILGMIVHNQHVTDAFEEDGIQSLDGPNRLEILKEVEKGTVIFTAHGVSPEVRQLARDKGLTVVDATCPDVTRTHNLIQEKTDQGYDIIYVGKKGHPEPEGAIGVAPTKVHLVENVDDVHSLHLDTDKIIITNQTTMSQWDVSEIMNSAIKRFPHAQIHNEICMATQVRQEAVAEQAKECDLVIVVGDPKSNNSNRLAQVSEEIAGTKAFRIGDVSELKLEWLEGVETVGVTSGASTPTPLTKEVITFIEQFNPVDEETWDRQNKIKLERILPKVRAKKK